MPALRAVRRALPDRRVGHAEIPARDGAGATTAAARSPSPPTTSGRAGPRPGGGGVTDAQTPSRRDPRQRFRRQVRQRQRLGLGVGQRALRQGDPAHGRAGAARNIFPSNIQGLPTWYEVRVVEAGWRGRRGGVDLMVAMNPQTWDKDVAEIDPGGYLFYDSTRAAAARRASATTSPSSACRSPRSATPNTRIRASASSSRTSSTWARCRRCSTSTPAEIEKLFAEQYKGKEALLESNRKALALGRDYALDELRLPAADPRASARMRSATAIFIDGNNAAALGLRVRRRDGLRVVSDHAVVVARRGVPEALPQVPRRSPRPARTTLRDRAGRGRARVDRHGDRRRLERRARVHGDLGPRHLADAGIHRPRVFRRDPGGALRRPARQPVDRHADAHAAGRPPALRVRVARRHEARAAVPGGSDRVLRDGAPTRSTSPTGCRRRSS